MTHKVPVQSLIDHIKTACDVDPWAKEMAEDLLKEQPEIVRCKDCRWGDRSRNGKGEEMIFCYNGDTGIEDGYLHEPNWFCAEGERKEGEVE